MRFLFPLTAILIFAASLTVAAAGPVRLALISECPGAVPASDLLLPVLSSNTNFHLLERDEVQKVYREQSLSAANRNEVKLGRILGADGLLFLKVVNTLGGTNLAVRLIAVKPGVVLTDSSFPWPVTDGMQWARELAAHLDSFFPKLALLGKDAIPISLVNLRSALASPGASDLERTLTLLTLRRLSREPRLFVLERQKLQLLNDEKSLNADESAFWSGSYLFEGSIDQQGVSAGRITIDARLVPPKGGKPILFTVTSSRTNLADAVNQLALRITSALEVKSTIGEWKPAEEALSYFEESKWALRWRCYPEAQSAAEAAWALGKTELECALVRLEAYRAESATSVTRHQKGSYSLGPSHDNAGRAVTPPPDESAVQSALNWLKTDHPIGFAYGIARNPAKGTVEISYMFTQTAPDPLNLERAARLLELYENLSRILASEWAQAGARDAAVQEAKWRNLGLEILITASEVLQNFYFAAPPQTSAGELAELRGLARQVAQQIYRSKPVADTYFVGNRVVTYDELLRTMPGSIFECMLKWGAWWQDKPEDAVALYRELMASPVFSFLHRDFWFRDLEAPRLVGWNEPDRERVPSVWQRFVNELLASTNALWQLEAKALAVADAPNPTEATLASSNLFAAMLERRDALVTNNVEVLYLNWSVQDLISRKTEGQFKEQTRKAFEDLTAMNEDWRKHLPERERLALFEKQKSYLTNHQSYQFFEFAKLFSSRNFSTNEALELRPLIADYKSNLIAQSQSSSNSGTRQAQLPGAIAQVGFLERDVQRILERQTPSHPLIITNFPKPATPATIAQALTHVMAVEKFLAIPLEALGDDITAAVITAHHWQEERLVLDLCCHREEVELDEKGRLKSTRVMVRSAVAVLEPATEHWTVLPSQDKSQTDYVTQRNRFYHHTTLARGQVFSCDAGRVRRYDAEAHAWRDVEACEPGNYELFAVSGRLFAADSSSILEIVEEGKGTHVLASNRRRPAASTLDTDELGEPIVFEGPGHSLRACTRSRIVAWADGDWKVAGPAPPRTLPPVFSPDGVLFATDGWNQHWCISRLSTANDALELCFGSLRRPPMGFTPPPAADEPKPRWKLPSGINLADLSAASRQPALYLLIDHAVAQNIFDKNSGSITGKRAMAQDGYHAAFLCFSTNTTTPLQLGLRFESGGADPPVTGEHSIAGIDSLRPHSWMLVSGQDLFLGREQSADSVHVGTGSRNPLKIGVWRIPLMQLDHELAAETLAKARGTTKQ